MVAVTAAALAATAAAATAAAPVQYLIEFQCDSFNKLNSDENLDHHRALPYGVMWDEGRGRDEHRHKCRYSVQPTI